MYTCITSIHLNTCLLCGEIVLWKIRFAWREGRKPNGKLRTYIIFNSDADDTSGSIFAVFCLFLLFIVIFLNAILSSWLPILLPIATPRLKELTFLFNALKSITIHSNPYCVLNFKLVYVLLYDIFGWVCVMEIFYIPWGFFSRIY